MGNFFSEIKKEPTNIKKLDRFGIEISYDGNKNIKIYDKKLYKIGDKYKLIDGGSDFDFKEKLRSIMFLVDYKNREKLIGFIKELPKDYKITILFIDYIDTNNESDIWHMIFYEKNIKPDLNWLTPLDKNIFNAASKKKFYR